MGWIMIRTLSLLLALMMIIAQHLWATAYTSTQAGNYSSAATWGGGGVPGAGDTFTANHPVAVDVDTTVGLSGSAGTVAGTVASGVILTVNTGIKFYVRGDLQLGGATNGVTALKMLEGSEYYFDGSVSNAAYKIIIGGAHYADPGVKVWTAGTSTNRVKFTSLGTSTGYFSRGGWVQSSAADFNFTDFSNINSPSGSFMDGSFGMWNSGSETGRRLRVNDCTFDGTGQFKIDYAADTNYINIQRNNWKNSLNKATPTPVIVLHGTNSDPTGNHIFKNNAIDGVVEILQGRSYGTVSGSVFLRRVKNTYEDGVAVLDGNFLSQLFGNGTGLTDIVNYDSGRTDLGLDIANNYFHMRSGSSIDVHSIQLGGGNGIVNGFGNIFENGAGNVSTYTDEGAMFMVSGGGWTLNAHHNIVLPDGGTHGTGRLIAALPASAGPHTFVMNIDSNTGAYVTGPLIKTGETYPGHSGMIGSLKNNLTVGIGDVLRGVLANHSNATKPLDALTDAVTKNNNIFNAYTGTNGIGYDEFNAANTPIGTTDLHVNPQFVDASRNLKTWDASLGGPGTDEHAIAEMAKMYSPDHDSRYTPSALISWVKAGFSPTNQALKSAGEGGTYIGAMDVVSLGNPAALMMVQ